jgi:L-fucose mutarotase
MLSFHMGHGAEIAIIGSSFPAAAVTERLIQIPGQTAPAVLDAALSLFPLDDFVE